MLKQASRLATVALGLIVAVTGAETLYAQTLEEVTVTAQRREQNLQDVGVSVTAFSGQNVTEWGFTNTVDIVAMTPSLNYTSPQAAGSTVNFFLRGVGLNDFADAQENPVAVYVDDVYKPAMGGLHEQLFDVERIEVLRGPQGALFGRNTTGGVIHYITRRPTPEFEAYADAMVGEESQVKAEGAISGPFTDTIAGRLSLAYNNHDGYVKNRTPGVQDYNGADSIAGRAQLQFNPSDRIDILLQAAYSDNDAEVGAWQHQAGRPSDDGNTSLPLPPNEDFWGSGPGNDAFGYRDSDGDPWAGDYDRNGSVQTENTAFAANINWSIGDIDLTSITAYTEVERMQEEDTEMNPFVAFIAPGTNTSFLAPTFAAETETLSQEFRIAGGADTDLRWLGGFYYFDNEVTGDYTLDSTFIAFVQDEADYVQETDSYAFFGQVEWDFADQWTLIAGLRWTQEEKEMDFQNIDRSNYGPPFNGSLTGYCSTQPAANLPDFALQCFNPVPTPVSPFRPTVDHAILFNKSTVGDLAEWDDDFWTGKIELDWRPNDDVLLYGSYSRGQKSPGFNSGFLDTTFVLGINPIPTIPFEEETLNAYEIGVKSEIFGGSTRLNAAAFYYDYEDFQTLQFVILNQIIFNTDAEVYGGELENVSSPAEGWDISLGISLLDATADDIPTLTADSVRERDMVAAPDITINGSVRYEWQALNGTMALMGWGYWQDDVWFDIQNHPISKQDSYGIANFRGSYTSGDRRWEVYAFLHNAFEEEYLNYTFDFVGTFGFNQQAPGTPRWWGVGARMNFGGMQN